MTPVRKTLPMLLGLLLAAATAADQPRTAALKAKDTAGADVAVPDAKRPTVLLFVRPDQKQSQEVVQTALAAAKGQSAFAVVAVLSGQDMGAAGSFAKSMPWSTILDADYAIVGQLQVHVWPTTLVVMPDGAELARVAGLPQTFAHDLGAYLDFATGKIDRPALDKRLATTDIVADSHAQQAARHRIVAQRLLGKGQADQAKAEVDNGLKLVPNDPGLTLLAARIALVQNDPKTALELAERLAKNPAVAEQASTLRGGALVGLNRADEAVTILTAATKLNPEPAETYYLLGTAYQLKGQPAEAAAAFRAAFEHTPGARMLVPTPKAPQPTK